MAALNFHLGPFARYVVASLTAPVDEIDSGNWQRSAAGVAQGKLERASADARQGNNAGRGRPQTLPERRGSVWP